MSGPWPPIEHADLDEVLAATASLWEEMRGERIFVTGGTGFFGCWLVESFLHANHALELNAKMTVLTRDAEAFLRRLPHLRGEEALTLREGDVRDFAFPAEAHRFVIHAATEASAKQLAEQPAQMLATMVRGTERVLKFAAAAGTRKLLLTSSGAVYGAQPAEVSHLPEESVAAPDSLAAANAYGEGKRVSELLCADAANDGLEVKIARCFAFVGPHLPLDAHFAAGNFLADALAGREVRIASDGRSVRSYLYASDLAVWLWTMLFGAPSLRAYNVGSEEAVTVRELAAAVVEAVQPGLAVLVDGVVDEKVAVHRYVPSTERARRELGLLQTVTLHEALRRTAAWHRLK